MSVPAGSHGGATPGFLLLSPAPSAVKVHAAKPAGTTEVVMLRLAIDPGTHCGYAMDGDARCSGVLDLSPRRHEGGGMRFLRFARWLAEISPTEVWYEEVAAHKGTAAAHIYGGLVATIQTYCEEHRVPYGGIPVGTVKKHATGKGNANKAAMVAAAREKLGYTGGDDNEADALWILEAAGTMHKEIPDDH